MIIPSSKSLAPPIGSPTRISEQELIRCVSRIRHDTTTGQPISFLGLESAAALPDWLCRIEADLKDSGIPCAQWSDAAILFLDGPVNMTMRGQRRRRIETGLYLWPWDDFKDALRNVLIDRGEHFL
ncbi:hypothetical protein GALMADRAFT_230383 [Galerina marginata CBS 339.88]|uniref:Uncharacterized protein n=1 Tax=Galerina marginata (strain CBS 339.88) TaxID=685588 RepID=A0A067SGN8_GALM3|nr:hypothetical protein GALMADRAFT_230383 [Galerina marginata CBS 339.88]